MELCPAALKLTKLPHSYLPLYIYMYLWILQSLDWTACQKPLRTSKLRNLHTLQNYEICYFLKEMRVTSTPAPVKALSSAYPICLIYNNILAMNMFPLALVSKLILLSSIIPTSKYLHQPSMSSMSPQYNNLESPPILNSCQSLFSNRVLVSSNTCDVVYLGEVGDISRSDDFIITCGSLHMTV